MPSIRLYTGLYWYDSNAVKKALQSVKNYIMEDFCPAFWVELHHQIPVSLCPGTCPTPMGNSDKVFFLWDIIILWTYAILTQVI